MHSKLSGSLQANVSGGAHWARTCVSRLGAVVVPSAMANRRKTTALEGARPSGTRLLCFPRWAVYRAESHRGQPGTWAGSNVRFVSISVGTH